MGQVFMGLSEGDKQKHRTINCLIIQTFGFYALEDYLKLHHNCLGINNGWNNTIPD